MSNRYIDGGKKRDQTTSLCDIENSDAEYGLVAQKPRGRRSDRHYNARAHAS